MQNSFITEEQYDALQQLVKKCMGIMLAAGSVEEIDGGIEVKPGDANFVTVFDKKVQDTAINGLKEIYPDAVFFAEEKQNSADDIFSQRCFVIDPIDGTTNFIHDYKGSSLSIAMLKNGVPVMGIIANPYKNEIFTAFKGCGAYLNGKKISVADRPLDKALFAFGASPYNKATLGDKGFKLAHKIFMRTADIRRSGSAAIDLADVACGRLDAFFECLLSPWDFAAGAVLITEAGGILTDFEGNAPDFTHPTPVLCANKTLHKEFLDIIQKEF